MSRFFLLASVVLAFAGCAPTYDLTSDDLAVVYTELEYMGEAGLEYTDAMVVPTKAAQPSPSPTPTATPPAPTVTPEPEPDWPSPVVIGGEFFIVNEAKLGDGSEDRCEDAVHNLKVDGYTELLVAGHADERGDWKSNEQLSSDRASKVRACLVEAFQRLDLTSPAMSILGFGEACPVTGRPEDVSNRRAEIYAYRDRSNVPTTTDLCPSE